MSNNVNATQIEHPWRATVRTLFASIVGLSASWLLIIGALGLDTAIPWVATSITVTGAITRVMALPAVIDWLEKFLPWLAPAPKEQELQVPSIEKDELDVTE